MYKYLLYYPGLSSAVAEAATFPFDLTKTRLQIQGEVATRGAQVTSSCVLKQRGMMQTAWKVKYRLFKIYK